MSFYSLDDYNNLKFTTSYTLPSSVNEIITKLASQLSVSIESVNHIVYKKKNNYKEIKDEDWKAKPFKTTIIVNNKSEHGHTPYITAQACIPMPQSGAMISYHMQCTYRRGPSWRG
jgi:hypothetical protein